MQSSSKEEEEEKVVTGDKLHQKFLNLQQEWDNLKKYSSNQRSRSFRRSKSSTKDLTVDSTTRSTLIHRIYNISPRKLMSSLQSNKPYLISTSPYSQPMWKVNDSVVKEILRDRREAIETGSLKGRRRLFESDDCFGDLDQAQEISEVGSVVSFDNDDDDFDADRNDEDDPFGSGDDNADDHIPLCFEEREVIEEREGEVEAEKICVGDNKDGRSYTVILRRWLVVVSIIFAIFIVASFGQFHVENEVILVPT